MLPCPMHRLLRSLLSSFILLGPSVFAPSVWAQGYDPYDGDDDFVSADGFEVLRNQIDLELIDLTGSSVSLRYERSLTPWVSAAIHPQWWWGGETSRFDFGVTLQLRWYVEGHAMNGWYVSPQFGFFQVSGFDDLGFVQTDHSYLYSLLAGYNWTIVHAVSMYFGGGIAYTNGSNRLEETWHYPLYVLGPFPVFEFGIGVPF